MSTCIKETCQKSFSDVFARTIAHTNYYSIEYMDARELREAIMEELLNVTMMERINKIQLDFGYKQLFKFVLRSHHKRIKAAMQHNEICELMDNKEVNGKIQLRIKNNPIILQTVMEYCGVFYDGFTVPEGVTVYGLSQATKDLLAANPIDEVVGFIAKQVFSNPVTHEPIFS